MTPIRLNIQHIWLSLVYSWLLSWLYTTEILPMWRYMGFEGEFSVHALAFSSISAGVVAGFIPQNRDTRAYLLTCLNYLFFTPSLVLMFFSEASPMHFISFAILVFSLFFFSAYKSSVLALKPLTRHQILLLTLFLTSVAVVAQAAFGGLQDFNLNIERVYEFRSLAASRLPPIFGYLYSNVSSVLIPIGLALSLKYRNYYFAAAIGLMTVVLFGMTHHKSVLFGPIGVLVLYMFFERVKYSYSLGIVFLGVVFACVSEIVIMRYVMGSPDPGYLTSLIVRRVLLVPSLLDSIYIDMFSVLQKYYWSSSRIGDWLTENPHGISAPFLVGEEFFGDPSMSANGGIIASGFSNAGLIGVVIYSVIVGRLISILNVYGKRIGHAFVTAASLAILFNIVTTTDLVTAVLTHGLLLLLMMLAIFPPDSLRGDASGTDR